MFSRIFTTSWQHISRTRLASIGIVTILTGLFLTFFIGFFLIQQAEAQRQFIIKKFNYPIFINTSYTLDDQKVLEFIQTLKTSVAYPDDIQYIRKEKVLDLQVQDDPSILKILGGENPLNDIIMVPFYGANLSDLISLVQSHADIFESIQSVDDMQDTLTELQGTMTELQRLTRITYVFLFGISILMVVLMILIIRLHIRIFQDERDVCDLVGASPFFYWSPHIVSIGLYILTSGCFSYGIFFLFQFIFRQ